jgi:hypothetical protein
MGMVSTDPSTPARNPSIETVMITCFVVALMDPISLLCSRIEIKPYTVLSHYNLLDHAGQEAGTHLMRYCISKIRHSRPCGTSQRPRNWRSSSSVYTLLL